VDEDLRLATSIKHRVVAAFAHAVKIASYFLQRGLLRQLKLAFDT